MKNKYYGSQWGGNIGLVTDVLPNIFLCVQQNNNKKNTGLEQPEGE